MKNICEKCEADPCICDDSHGYINETRRMSAAEKLQRAFEREQQKSAASRKRAEELMKPKQQPVKEAKEKTEYDYEGDMARGQLQSIINNAQRVHDMLEDNDNLPEWVQSKITLAEDYISTVANYMMSEIDEEIQQVDEIVKPDVKNDIKTLDPVAFVKKHGVKKGQAKAMAEESSMAEKQAQKQYRNARKDDVPFDPPYTSGKPSVVPGKHGAGYSTARHLARQAMNKAATKYKTPIKEEGELSRKSQIIKDAAKKGRKKDTFNSEPIISKSEVKM